MNQNRMLIVILTILALVGCSKKKYSTDFLLTNDEIRSKVLDDCVKDKDIKSENCRNASNAQAAANNDVHVKELEIQLARQKGDFDKIGRLNNELDLLKKKQAYGENQLEKITEIEKVEYGKLLR